MNKPVICLNILGLETIKVDVQEMLGIKKCINTWEEFSQMLNLIEKNNYKLLNYINYDRVIRDGNCYNRIITLVKNMINISIKRNNSTN